MKRVGFRRITSGIEYIHNENGHETIIRMVSRHPEGEKLALLRKMLQKPEAINFYIED